MAPQYKLTYFDSRALGEPARFAFAYAGVAYQDERVVEEEWDNIKKSKYQYKICR